MIIITSIATYSSGGRREGELTRITSVTCSEQAVPLVIQIQMLNSIDIIPNWTTVWGFSATTVSYLPDILCMKACKYLLKLRKVLSNALYIKQLKRQLNASFRRRMSISLKQILHCCYI